MALYQKPQLLRQILASVPENPGVYKYFDREGKLLYIGKAKNLRKRVGSYFGKQHDHRKTRVLVSKIDRIDYTVVDTEMDALLLENNLIKEFQPRYNVNLKDDKSFPFIRITNERFPRVFPMRNPQRDGSEYYGPYTSVRMMNVILDFIKQLYPVRNCTLNLSKENIQAGKFKICLEYQIGNCTGPCEGLEEEVSYNERIEAIRNILKGHLSEVKIHLRKEMQHAADHLRFERAQQYKDKLEMVDRYQSRSTIVNNRIHNVDVFSIAEEGNFAFVNFLKVANGMIIQTQTIEYRKKLNESPEELLELAIAEIRNRYHSNAREVIAPFPLELENDEFSITIPKAGDKKKLLDLSKKNALHYKRERLNQYEKLNPDLRTDRLMERMKSDLRLKDAPRHIECFDNSNIQGNYPVSACVVFKDGKPAKKDYRHFNIKTVQGPDDFASMREVIQRRYQRLLNEDKPLPQLIVVDGGKGQLSSAVEVLKELGIYSKVAIIGIAKRLEEIYYPDDPLPLYIDKSSETLKVIQQMRDEAHRFGITHHRKKRSKGSLQSTLKTIPGIGEATATELLRIYGSVKKLRDVSKDEIAAHVGLHKASIITQFFQQEAEK